ncbi:D-2-hydroxyacid dehydrogenase [Ruminococcaceae bacterium OttesenSCG-928-D13]|nr:D-2-hydroxyacid dehydrogenase [Ruminococcaceae bacterium OttesenSCG-928-D13]
MPEKMKVLILTAEDSQTVFRMDSERLEAALSRHPLIRELAEFEICRTSTSFENTPGWNENDYEMFYRAVADKDAMIGYMFPLETFREKAPHVKYVHIIGAGVEHLFPLTWLPEHTKLTNSRGAHAPKTCEYAMMAMLMLGNNIPRLVTAQHEHRWDGHFLTVVEGKTALVVGCGKQGSAVALAAKRLGIKAIGVDPYVPSKDGFEKIVHPDKLLEVLPEADYVFLTMPATKDSYHFYSTAQFAAMKPGAGFVNICRGKVLDADALLAALESGQISGAVLDVFEEEPLPSDSPLWSAKNIVLTPHMGCDDEVNYIPRCIDIFFRNLARLPRGEELENQLDPELGF